MFRTSLYSLGVNPWLAIKASVILGSSIFSPLALCRSHKTPRGQGKAVSRKSVFHLFLNTPAGGTAIAEGKRKT
jgi:hypothetical protein